MLPVVVRSPAPLPFCLWLQQDPNKRGVICLLSCSGPSDSCVAGILPICLHLHGGFAGAADQLGKQLSHASRTGCAEGHLGSFRFDFGLRWAGLIKTKAVSGIINVASSDNVQIESIVRPKQLCGLFKYYIESMLNENMCAPAKQIARLTVHRNRNTSRLKQHLIYSTWHPNLPNDP